MSYIDYANAILVGLPQSLMMKPQRVQNMAAGAVLCDNAHDCTMSEMVPLASCETTCEIEIPLMVYKGLNKLGPNCTRALLTLSVAIPMTRSYSRYQLPNDLMQCTTVEIVKTKLKTLLFDEFY